MTARPLLLGFTVPDDVAAELFAMDPFPSVQTHRFAWSLARSLRFAFGEVRLLSAAPVQNWPLVPRLVFRRRAFGQQGIDGVAVGFVNVIGLKHLTRFVAILFQSGVVLWRWKVNIVFVHGTHTPWLAYGRLLQCLGLRVAVVLTDPPGVIRPTDGLASRWLKQLDRQIVRYFVSRASAVVALAPDLAVAYPGPLRTLVFPGILSGAWLEQLAAAPPRALEAQPLTVLYAGALNAAYGVDRLLDAALLLPEVRFVLLGKGDQVARITPDAFPNVTYGGFVSPEALAPHVLAADILINPRPSDADFARSSFPSKLLEYAAAGRPVLTTRIRSIPDAIASCFHYIDDETPEGIARAIENLAVRPTVERLAVARRSQNMVVSEYSEEAVGRQLAALFPPRQVRS